MPLLTFEGVEVDIPTSLAGIQFAFADGSLSIRCSGFSGDIVLSKPASKDAERLTGSKKRTIDLSASDDDESDSGGRPDAAAPKRARPNFLSTVEESMLLAQLDPTSSAASSPQSSATAGSEMDSVISVDSHSLESKDSASGGKTKAVPEQNKTFSSTAASVMSAFLRGGKDAALAASNSKKTAQSQSSLPPSTKKNQKPAKKSKQDDDATAASSIVSPEPKLPTSRSATPESNQKKRGRKKKLEDNKFPASSQPTKPTTSKLPAVTARWETLVPSAPANTAATSSAPSPPIGRWGHSATAISDDRIVVYGGADDDERTLGDLHVFDLSTRTWSRPLNCESLPRTWHDAVYLDTKHLLLVFGGERLIDSGSAGASGGETGEEASASADGHMDILADIMVLDTECFLWYPPAIRGSPPSARSGHTCTVLRNDVVVFGGSRGRNRQSSVHVLDSDEWMWRSIAIDGKPPSARTYHSAVAIDDNRIVYFGGNDSHKCFNSVHVLEKSSSLSAKKRQRGGKKSTDDDKDELDSSPTTSWSWFHPCVVGDPPRARTGHTATLVDDHKVLIVGGWDPQSDAGGATVVFNDAFLLDTTTWEWQRVPVEAATGDVSASAGHEDADAFSWVFPGRVGHRAVLDKRSGRVLLFGGQDARDDRLSTINALSLSFGAPASSASQLPAASSLAPTPLTGAPPPITGGIVL